MASIEGPVPRAKMLKEFQPSLSEARPKLLDKSSLLRVRVLVNLGLKQRLPPLPPASEEGHEKDSPSSYTREIKTTSWGDVMEGESLNPWNNRPSKFDSFSLGIEQQLA